MAIVVGFIFHLVRARVRSIFLFRLIFTHLIRFCFFWLNDKSKHLHIAQWFCSAADDVAVDLFTLYLVAYCLFGQFYGAANTPHARACHRTMHLYGFSLPFFLFIYKYSSPSSSALCVSVHDQLLLYMTCRWRSLFLRSHRLLGSFALCFIFIQFRYTIPSIHIPHTHSLSTVSSLFKLSVFSLFILQYH